MKKKEYKTPSIIVRRIHINAIMVVSDIPFSDGGPLDAKGAGDFDDDEESIEGNIFDEE